MSQKTTETYLRLTIYLKIDRKQSQAGKGLNTEIFKLKIEILGFIMILLIG